MKPSTLQSESRWPRRLSVALVCATFPLIWVGGLVTTYDAGMAVPDWPTTYGYNLFLYPWQTWLFGPWDLFIEHGHRLLGAVVGMITLALAWSVWRTDRRGWMRGLALAAVALVIFQGVLGGARVLLDQRTLAMLHGCVGPLFFAYAAVLAAMLSPPWRGGPAAKPHADGGSLRRLALLTLALAYVQLVLGARLRHIPVTASPNEFQAALALHLVLAAALAAHIIALAWRARSRFADVPAVWRPAAVLLALVAIQLSLGAGSYVVKYSWPSWMHGFGFAASHTVQSESMTQAMIVTAHVAVGSLILATAAVTALKSFRYVAAAKASSVEALVAAEASV